MAYSSGRFGAVSEQLSWVTQPRSLHTSQWKSQNPYWLKVAEPDIMLVSTELERSRALLSADYHPLRQEFSKLLPNSRNGSKDQY